MSKKNLLLASTLLSGLIIAAPALAQDEPPVTDDSTTVGELVITGTRLRLPEYTLPNPVTSVGSFEIGTSGEGNVTDFLLDMPALVGSLDDVRNAEQSTPDLVGLNLLDLRNLGDTRTLVLVNGRRHVAGYPGTASVDVNTIPTDLIDRVDILTGGSSAIYGADAVSGAVNFVMKRDFEGLRTRTQLGFSEDGGGQTRFQSVIWGKNFNDDRLNVTVGAEYYSRDDVKFRQRDYTAPGKRRILITNPAEVDQTTNRYTDDPNVIDNILVTDARYIDTSLEGSIITQDDFEFRYLGNGQPFVTGTLTGSFIMIGGSGSLLDLYNDDLLPGVDRFNLNFMSSYNFNDRHRAFTELKYVRSDSDFVGQPTYDYGLYIPLDNPFIPGVALADAQAAVSGGYDIASVFGLAPGVLVARDNFDIGATTWDIRRETYRAVFGLEGALTDNIDYEASFVYGKSRQNQRGTNIRINERFFAATDVTTDANGNAVCRSNLDPDAIPFGDIFAQFAFDPATWGTTFTPGPNSGCVPLNIFGQGVADQAAIDWVNTDITDRSEIDQYVLNAYVTGTTEGWFEIPTGGAPSFVFGGEYRKEKSRFNPDALELMAEATGYPITFIGAASRTTGEFDVSEAFTELSLPLLLDKPFAREFTVLGAYRYSDYSTAGDTNTWNVGLRWRPTSDIMFRATKAKAVRAPNIVDLFLGKSQTFGDFADPCSAENLGEGENPTLRRAQCNATLAQFGYAPDSYADTSSEAVAGDISGNPLLRPEEADTETYGVVFTPSFIPGLTASIDYYDIAITDAIQSYAAQTIINNCYDLPQPNQFCDLLTRQGVNDPFPGRIRSFSQVPGNIARYETSGLDFTIRYRLDPARFGIERDIGQFTFNLVGNRLNKLVFIETSGAIPDEDDGDQYAPEWQATFDVTWERGPWMVNYGFNYFDETRRVSRVTAAAQPDYVAPGHFWYSARKEHDIQVAYRMQDEKFEIYGGVNNFTNQKPEFDDYMYPVSPLGRFFYMGLKARWQ